jgi:hypothetical protein
MIPVIGATIVTNPKWIKRLYESIDFPTKNFYIIDNSGNADIKLQLETLLSTVHNPFIENLHITTFPGNIGVAGAWNLIIKSFLMEPYWIITSDDVAFTPGFLEEMYTAQQPEDIGIVHGYGGDFGDGAWDLFLIKDWVVQQFGLFDENFYPAYCEDVDYIMRTYGKVKKVCQLEKKYLHGDGQADQYYTHGSQTKKSSSELTVKLDNINVQNFEYMNQKWGPGWRTTSPYPHPFNSSILDSKTNTFDLEFARSKYLGF